MAILPVVSWGSPLSPSPDEERGLVVEIPGEPMSFDLGDLADLAEVELDPAGWTFSCAYEGKLGDMNVRLVLRYDETPTGPFRPQHLLWSVEAHRRDEEKDFFLPDRRVWTGEVGHAPYLVAGVSRRTEPGGRGVLGIGGTAEYGAWCLDVEVDRFPEEKDIEEIRSFVIDSITFDGCAQSMEWTDEEAARLWGSLAPTTVKGDLEIQRTDHYIVLTNASAGRTFSRMMEECYELVLDAYPFEDVPGERLLPVVLFRTREEYNDYQIERKGVTREQARRSGGECNGEYYVTYYDSPQVESHVYLATQQIVRNRHRSTRGNTWFRAGLGEYLETPESERKQFSRRVKKKNDFVPLAEFMTLSTFSLLDTEERIDGGNTAFELYDQSAALAEFFVESKFAKKRRGEFLRLAGNLPRTDRAALEALLGEVYDVGFEELEKEFVRYWSRR